MMYLLKVKGKAKIPDYIQLRDSNYTLIAYFRADRELKNPEKYGLQDRVEELKSIIAELEYGKLRAVNW